MTNALLNQSPDNQSIIEIEKIKPQMKNKIVVFASFVALDSILFPISIKFKMKKI